MKKLILILIAAIIIVTGCTTHNTDPKIEKWDNTKYEQFSSSVGIDVFNEHSFNEPANSNKINRTLYISDLTKPITVKFNNNGKDRDFVMNVYYDYRPITFKINENGHYDQSYRFKLGDGYEIALPMYLPPDVKMSGAHKLFITFNIGSEIHAKELNQIIPWYGASIVQDIVFESSLKNVDFIPQAESTKPANESDLQYDYTLNQDYDFRILKTGVMPSPPVTLTVKPQEKFKLMYNVSYPGNKAGQVLIMATVGFKSATVNDKPYLLVDVPESKTAIGEINLVAPKTTGLYEVISYSINSPFEKIDGKSLEDFRAQAAPRFTLEVKD